MNKPHPHDHSQCNHDHTHEHDDHSACDHHEHSHVAKPNYEPDTLPAVDHSLAENKITMTEAAITHVTKYLDNHSSALGLRLRVKKSGCSGLAYVNEYAEQQQDDDLLFKINDRVTIYVDSHSFPYLKGTCVDYKQIGLSGGMLKCVNPNEVDSCGCGSSFNVK